MGDDPIPWPINWGGTAGVVALVLVATRWLVLNTRAVGEDRRRDLEAERRRCWDEKERLYHRIAELEAEMDRLRKGEA